MPTKVQSYVGTVVVAALTSLAAIFVVAPRATQSEITAVLTLTAIALAAELLGYELSNNVRGSITFIPYLAALLLSPSALCLVAFSGAIFVSNLVRRNAPVKILFNTAQMMLAGALGVLFFRLLGGAGMLVNRALYEGAFPLSKLPSVVALAVVFMTVNTLAVQGIIAMNDQTPVFARWKRVISKSFAYDLFSSPVVYLFAWVFLRSGVWGVLFLTIPLLAVRQLYKTNYQLERVNQELLELMVKAIEARDPYTSGHSRRVSQYSKIIARAIGLGGGELERVSVAALLHDVGKIHEMYAPILRKPEKLSPAEWSVMQTHPIKSADLVATVSHLADIVAPVRHHHENWDGTGYPDGLQGEQIPLAARIVLFADTIDAMTTDRPYRKALSEAQVRSELVKFRGKQFDPAMCDKLLASPMFGLLFAPHQRETTPEHGKPVLGTGRERAAATS
jgi:HD superfamily phosphohydrolase YqeK